MESLQVTVITKCGNESYLNIEFEVCTRDYGIGDNEYWGSRSCHSDVCTEIESITIESILNENGEERVFKGLKYDNLSQEQQKQIDSQIERYLERRD